MESNNPKEYNQQPQSVYNNPTQYNISIGEIKHTQILNASDLDKLKQVDPRLIDLFIDSYSKEQQSIQELRLKVLELEQSNSDSRYKAINKGQNFAFISYVFAVIAGVLFAWFGHEVVGTFFAILMSTLTKLSNTFITGEKNNKNEGVQKWHVSNF